MSTSLTLLTAEEFLHSPDPGCPVELIRGKVVMMNMPGFRHGVICGNACFILRQFTDEHALGRVLTNDSGIITEHHPDTVRGADVAYYSYERLPKDSNPTGYPDVAPDVVFEVRSPSDRWSSLLTKVGEYLDAGVHVVCVLDDETRTAGLYYRDKPAQTLVETDELTLPEIHDKFRLGVARFFQ